MHKDILFQIHLLWHYCDNDIVSQSSSENVGAYVTSKEMACLSNECLYSDALWVKIVRTLISPELVWTSYIAVSFCCVLRNVTNLSLSRISNFKRSWNLLIGVSTCLYALWITWSLKYNISRSSQTNFSFYYLENNVRTNGLAYPMSPLATTKKVLKHRHLGGAVEGDPLEQQGWPVPQVVALAEVLQDGGLDGYGGVAVGHGLNEGVERAGVTVLLESIL